MADYLLTLHHSEHLEEQMVSMQREVTHCQNSVLAMLDKRLTNVSQHVPPRALVFVNYSRTLFNPGFGAHQKTRAALNLCAKSNWQNFHVCPKTRF